LRPHDESAGAELIGRREESDSSGGPHTTGFANQKGTLRNHDYHYKRNGTATLFAAMDALDGAVISMRGDRHRHQEWLKFLRVIDEVIPPTSNHLIADKYAIHKHPKVQKPLARHPKFHIYFTPTSSSWLNMVERYFRGPHSKPALPRHLP